MFKMPCLFVIYQLKRITNKQHHSIKM